MAQGIHGDNLLLVGPLRKWTNVGSRLGIREIWSGSLQQFDTFMFRRFSSPIYFSRTILKEGPHVSLQSESSLKLRLVGKVGGYGLPMVDFYLLAGDCKGVVYRVRPAMCYYWSIKFHFDALSRSNAPPMAVMNT